MKKVFTALTAAALAATLAGCSSSVASSAEDKTITVGATAVPHAMILNDVVADVLAEEGWTLKVVEFSDYVQPNQSLEDGELDANYFQTLAYMEDQNEAHDWHLVAAQGIHYEPMTLFSKDYTEISEFQDGDQIAIPNDYDNEKRALILAASTGLIEYDPDLAADSPLDGITSNPLNIDFVEIEAALVPQQNADVAGLIVNGNYALEANLKDSANTVFVEQLTDEQIEARINYVVVKEGNEETDKTKALIAAITSDAVAEYIEENYGSAVICTFKD